MATTGVLVTRGRTEGTPTSRTTVGTTNVAGTTSVFSTVSVMAFRHDAERDLGVVIPGRVDAIDVRLMPVGLRCLAVTLGGLPIR